MSRLISGGFEGDVPKCDESVAPALTLWPLLFPRLPLCCLLAGPYRTSPISWPSSIRSRVCSLLRLLKKTDTLLLPLSYKVTESLRISSYFERLSSVVAGCVEFEALREVSSCVTEVSAALSPACSDCDSRSVFSEAFS